MDFFPIRREKSPFLLKNCSTHEKSKGFGVTGPPVFVVSQVKTN